MHQNIFCYPYMILHQAKMKNYKIWETLFFQYNIKTIANLSFLDESYNNLLKKESFQYYQFHLLQNQNNFLPFQPILNLLNLIFLNYLYILVKMNFHLLLFHIGFL